MRGFRSITGWVAAATVAAALPALLMADPVLPTTPGLTYRIVFVTAETTTAWSTDINYYNAFATEAADSNPQLAALGLSWAAVATTFNTSWIQNVEALGGTGDTPIYNTDGELVATGNSQLFVGYLNNPIDFDQNGAQAVGEPGQGPFDARVWTGSLPLDLPDYLYECEYLGCAYLGAPGGGASFGEAQATIPSQWMFADINGPDMDIANLYYIYAISSEYTNPSSVPEPPPLTLLLPALAVLLLRHRGQ